MSWIENSLPDLLPAANRILIERHLASFRFQVFYSFSVGWQVVGAFPQVLNIPRTCNDPRLKIQAGDWRGSDQGHSGRVSGLWHGLKTLPPLNGEGQMCTLDGMGVEQVDTTLRCDQIAHPDRKRPSRLWTIGNAF